MQLICQEIRLFVRLLRIVARFRAIFAIPLQELLAASDLVSIGDNELSWPRNSGTQTMQTFTVWLIRRNKLKTYRNNYGIKSLDGNDEINRYSFIVSKYVHDFGVDVVKPAIRNLPATLKQAVESSVIPAILPATLRLCTF